MILSRPFEAENKQSENKNRAAGIIVTVLVHALLLIGLYFLFITPPDPPYTDNAGGTTVNFGTSDVGTGDQQQFTAVPVKVQEVQENTPTPPAAAATAPEDLETQDKEDAPVIEKKTVVKKEKVKPNPDAAYKPTKKPAVETVSEPKPQVDKNALFSSGALGKPNNSKGDGEGKGKGDQGNPDGDPNSKNYHGGGNGNGHGTGNGTGPGGDGPGTGDRNVHLGNRKIKGKPKFSYDCNARGKVVMIIKVNKSGKVVGADFTQSGSTTADDCLINRAHQLALEYSFDDNSTAADIQQGSITFIFKED